MTTQAEGTDRYDEGLRDVSDVQAGTLPIPGTNPVVIHIHMKSYQGNKVPVFTMDDKTFYAGGLGWAGGGSSTAMFITFHLGSDITGVDCDDQQYSPSYGNSNNRQMMSIAPIDGTFDFFVDTGSGRHIDPKIIVTPIPRDPDC